MLEPHDTFLLVLQIQREPYKPAAGLQFHVCCAFQRNNQFQSHFTFYPHLAVHLSLKTTVERLHEENEFAFEFSHRSLIVDGKPNIFNKKAIGDIKVEYHTRKHAQTRDASTRKCETRSQNNKQISTTYKSKINIARTWKGLRNNCKYALKCFKAKDERALHDEVVYLLFRRDGKVPSFHQSVHNLARPSLKSSARELLKAYIWIINTLMIPTRAERAMPEAKFFRCTLFLGTPT